jgi:hypothetical protein
LFKSKLGEYVMTNKTAVIQKLSFFLIACVIILAAGCRGAETEIPLPPTQEEPTTATATLAPTPEPALPNSVITLPDGSMIILSPDAQIEVLQQPGLPARSEEITVMLLQGKIMAVPDFETGPEFTVQTTAGYTAQTNGCAMVVSFEEPFTFELQCIGGDCQIGESPDSLDSVSSNHIWEYQVNTLTDKGPIEKEMLQTDYGDNLPACVISGETRPTATATVTITPTPTRTLTPTPDLGATATAACETFHEEFPATPCP